MELYQKFKQNGYFTAELYHLLTKKKMSDVSEEITPSEYEKEMTMSSSERLKYLNTIEVENIVRRADRQPEQVVLSFTPRLLVFQNFKQNDKLVAKFTVKNISTALINLSMVCKESPHFTVKSCGAGGAGSYLLSRLAPGISATFAVTFTPVACEDYVHKVTFLTDKDQYVLVILAIGPRPLFTFPDEVAIPCTPLKIENSVHVVVKNVGTTTAGFTLCCRSPFAVHPKSAYLNPQETIDLKVSFKSMHLGETQGFLYALFETGENFRIRLLGSTCIVKVELEKSIIRFEETYNTLVRQQTLKITNKSHHLLSFMCMKNEDVLHDFEDKVNLVTVCYDIKESKASKFNKLEYYEVLSSEEHQRIYQRIFYNEVQSIVADQTLHFQNTHFSVAPIEGHLWPNKTSELTITFTPKEIGDFNALVYLDIDGVFDRVPLQMVGTSLPPNIQLHLETLDMCKLFINKTYKYEVVVVNKGHINGLVAYTEPQTLFGSIITCTPEKCCLKPGDKEVFVISFSNSNQGPFFEEINFVIRDTKVVLKLYLKGEVIYPFLMFNIPCLDFGIVSLGMPKTLELEVINDSVADVRAILKIASDGPDIGSITLTDYAVADWPKPVFPQWPKEFKIEPSHVFIGPESSINLKVTLTANLIRTNHTSLELEIDKSDGPPVVLPVVFKAVVPELVLPPDIKERASFIDFMYKKDIVIRANEYWGYFTIPDPEEETVLKVTTSMKEGWIEPNSTIVIPIEMESTDLGEQEYQMRMQLFGMSRCIDICHISTCGVRPIVYCNPMVLHWGQVKLLTTSVRTLTVTNDSPVPVNFNTSLLNAGKWKISPSEGQMEPESTMELVLTLYLVDADTYSNKALIHLEKVKDIIVPLTATGVGTCIVIGELRDRINLGRHFTKLPMVCNVTIENQGTKFHSLEWSEFAKAPKNKGIVQSAFFNIEPRIFKLAAAEKLDMTITGMSTKKRCVEETWYLIGNVEGINKKEILMECPVTAEFVDPTIELSSTVMELRYDYGPYNEYYNLTDILSIKNVSTLPLDIEINVKQPFAIIQKQNYKIRSYEENLCHCICYDKYDINIQKMMNEIGPKESKIFIDYLTLQPVEPQRKEPLNFFQDINKIKMVFNLTYNVKERLEDGETVKIQILLDTTKHTTLKSKIYTDLMKIRFKGHKNKDTVKLIGRINFPNIQTTSPLDFPCLLNGCVESKTIKIHNVSPLLVCYRFQWKKYAITSVHMPEVPEITLPSEKESKHSAKDTQETLQNEPSTLETNMKMSQFQTIAGELSTVLKDLGLDYIPTRIEILKKITPMIDTEYASEFEWIHKFCKVSKPLRVTVNDVFQVIPNRGLLRPNEIQYIHVMFRPKDNISVKAKLECEVLGGPTETIIVTGQSSSLMYKISTQKLNFRIRSFHENATEIIEITNVAQCPIELIAYMNEPEFVTDLECIILSVDPAYKILHPDEKAEIQVIMRPGVVGYFHRTFLMEIGNLPHLPIDVFGWGVVPQVYLSLTRPEIGNLPEELGYMSIPSITSEYLAAVYEIFSRGDLEHTNSPQAEKCFEDPLFGDDWHLCSPWDGYPSIIDIELSIERLLVTNHLKLRPDILTMFSKTQKPLSIPGFYTTPYVIDFGVVITGCTAQCIADIINYGPIETKVHISKYTKTPSWLTVKLCKKLNPGETCKLEVLFCPNSKDFPEVEQKVETSFNLEVPYGVTMPIHVKSLCAVPYLKSNVSTIDFGAVRCGNKVIATIPTKNVGKPTCIWYVSLRLKVKGPNPITVLNNSGRYEPGEGGYVSVSFKPTMETTYEGLLVFRFHMNPTEMKVRVRGQGIVPQVQIIGPNVCFPPTLPWADTSEIYFGLTNPCPFPIELIFAHCDQMWAEEDKIYQLLQKYYNKPEEMLVPAIKPGAGLPNEVVNFYKNFTDRVNRILQEEAKAAATAGAPRGRAASISKKSAKHSARSQSTTTKDTLPVVRTEAEVIADEIQLMKDAQVDPLKESLDVFDPPVSSSRAGSKGLLVFFHGSPCEEMQAQEMAHNLGKKLNLPTLSIDVCIVEALCECDCPAKNLIMTAVNDLYDMLLSKNEKETVEEQSKEAFGETEDEFDVIWKKLVYIMEKKSESTPKAGEKRKKENKTTSTTTISLTGPIWGATTLFNEDLIQELLNYYFDLPKFNKGFILETLSSVFLRMPATVLTIALRCKPDIWNAHLVLCHAEFNKQAHNYAATQKVGMMIDDNLNTRHTQHYASKQKVDEMIDESQPKEYTVEEIEEIVKSIEEMDDEEYEMVDPELRAIYITHGLAERRRKHCETIGTINETQTSNKGDQSKSMIAVNASSVSQKKLKKDDSAKKKDKKDDSAQKKDKKDDTSTKVNPNPEYIITMNKYTDYNKNVYDSLVTIANNWIMEIGDVGFPPVGITGQFAGPAPKKAKGKSETTMLKSPAIPDEERGFPLTMIMYPCLQYKEALTAMFYNSPLVREALKDKEEVDILAIPVNRKEYTVLMPKTMPSIHNQDPLKWCFLDENKIKKCECNQLTDLNLLDDTRQDNVINILCKWHCVCGKKMVSSETFPKSAEKSTSVTKISSKSTPKSTSTTITSAKSPLKSTATESEVECYPQPKPLRSVNTVAAPASRIVLDPGDLVRCKYTFNPQVEGEFALKRYVEVSGWPDSRVVVSVSAICTLPRIDSRPKKMFADFVRRTLDDVVYKLSYLDDLKVFQFGPIFVGANRVYEEGYTIDVRNASLLTADIVIAFLNDTNVFLIDKTQFVLEPGSRDQIKITAALSAVGVHNNVLILSIKDNPEVVTINISCTGVIPKVEVLPTTKLLDYKKLLLYRREDDRFIVKNDSILPIMWKVRNPKDFAQDFIISHISGIVPRYDNQVVPVTYTACTVGVISNKTLTIDIYDELGRGQPMIVNNIQFSAECYDVLVECAYEDPDDPFLNYGNVKVNSTVDKSIFLLNKGKYSIYYKLKKVKNFPEPQLLKTFQVTPECGMVPPAKLCEIAFECTPKTSVNLFNVPAYTCSLLDGSKSQIVVAKFPICVTIASFYNTFTLFPLGELNFDIIPVGVGVPREVILNNTSKCPFTYEIIVPEKYRVDPDDLSSPKPKGKENNKIKLAPIKCGQFQIFREDNLLPPGTSRTLQIQFFATAAKTFEETIKFVVSDTCPAEAEGVPLKLVGTGAIPTLDFWDIETTFRGHLIVKNLADYKVKESSPHCVFVEDSVTFHFFSVIVGTSFTGQLDLYNNGLVPSVLTMKLNYQSKSDQRIFSLDKYDTVIEPLQHKDMGVTFSPKALEEYRAVLEIKLKLLNQEKTFKICLIGEGVIPRISLLSPPLRHNKLAALRFPVTCLGTTSNEKIIFKNTSRTKCTVELKVLRTTEEERPAFKLTDHENSMAPSPRLVKWRNKMEVTTQPDEVATIMIQFNPERIGRTSCDIKLKIVDNPYEYVTVLCEAEAFIEDVILIGLEMLPIDEEVDVLSATPTTSSKPKSQSKIPKSPKSKASDAKKGKKPSSISMKSFDNPVLKYVMDFGGCELGSLQKRSVAMSNNSDKVYKFEWEDNERVVVKPSKGYISPAEEKDLEFVFFSSMPTSITKELLNCTLLAVSNDFLMMDIKGTTWDNRQTITVYNHNTNVSLKERQEQIFLEAEKMFPPPDSPLGSIHMMVLYSATTEYTKYSCDLNEDINLLDTFIYQKRTFEFTVENTGLVPLKIVWRFYVDESYPARLNKVKEKKTIYKRKEILQDEDSAATASSFSQVTATIKEDAKEDEDDEQSKVTLYSENTGRESADTWFDIDIPFTIEPIKVCLNPKEKRIFKVTFAPLDAFYYKIKLKSVIDNLDPYENNITCKISAKSLIPYVHLDIEDTDYLTSGRRKSNFILPQHTSVLEFDVLGAGCYKKTFSVINPTEEAYEFVFEKILEGEELVPVHCDKLMGFVEGGTSTQVTFTFAPTAPGIYESQWKFKINAYDIVIPILVVGAVREPDVVFIPTILNMKNSMVGFTITENVVLRNNESVPLKFEFKGNSLCNESGKTPIVVEPEKGTLKPTAATPIKIIYTPIQDGPLAFKIFCSVTYLTKYLTLCVNALSHCIKPKVTYCIIGNEHELGSDDITNIHLDQTASKYGRTIPFTIKNDGSATFFFDWHYSCTAVKKYLEVFVEPKSGHVAPGNHTDCVLHFNLIKVPVKDFPLALTISDGPEYTIYLHSEIEKPKYQFSCMNYDFGKCIVNAPESTYKKNIAFVNKDEKQVTVDLRFENLPELYVQYRVEPYIEPDEKLKIVVYFRPKQVKHYEFQLHFWVNSLCEEIVTIKGEGVPLLFDLFEGCQKSFDLGPVKLGQKIIRQIEVMNHSEVPIDATFLFKEMYNLPSIEDTTPSEATSVCFTPPTFQATAGEESRVVMLQSYKDDKVRKQIEMDIQNALSSLKVTPTNCKIKPYRKLPIKIQFKPVGLISSLQIQLNMRVLEFERPLVRLSGSATGMSFSFSQNSLQFGRVRKRGLKILKVMLSNKGDFGARFWWQPLVTDEFQISPMYGHIAAHTNVTFTVTFRPKNHNPFIKVWASCNIENYMPLELAMYATCMDVGAMQSMTLYFTCPVRTVATEYLTLTNPSDDVWRVLSEIAPGIPFETLKEFNIEPNSTFSVPISFKPKVIGKVEGQILFAPLGSNALYLTVVGAADHPNPNGSFTRTVPAKEMHSETFEVYNITEKPESYAVLTEVVQIIPDKFTGYYEIKHPETVKVWGEAVASCPWSLVCYEECEMQLKVMFIDEETQEYQFYNLVVQVTPCSYRDYLTFTARARETYQIELKCSNPLSDDAEFVVESKSLQCPSIVKIGKKSEATITLTYSPLVVGDSEEFLEIHNELVGTLVYKVMLKCLPAKEKEIEFTTALGTCIPIRLRVQNRTEVSTEFITSTTHSSIIADGRYKLGPLEKGKFLLYFEPTQLGVQDCKVSFMSPVAGEFVFNITGKATEPKPQGPIEIKPGSFSLINFKNVFDDTRSFRIQVDSEDFYVKTMVETLKSKKDVKVAVYLNVPGVGSYDRLNMPAGCLVIEPEPPEHKVQWTYFLKGMP